MESSVRTRQLRVGLPWLLLLLPVAMGGVVTFNKFVLPAAGMNSKDVMYCAHNATNGSYAGIRFPASGDACELLTNADYNANGQQAGYQYSLKKAYQRIVSPPDNIAPNPYPNTYVEIPGVFEAGMSIEYVYTKTAPTEYTVEFVDEGWSKLLMKFHVNEATDTVLIASLDYETNTWSVSHYPPGWPFALQEYKLKFTFTTTAIEISVNGAQFYAYNHAYPFTMLRWVRFLLKPHSLTTGIQVSDLRVVIP